MKRCLAKRNHPWELLVIAALFPIPATMMLSQREPFLFPSFGNRVAKVTVWSSSELHVFGWFGVFVALVLVFLYFYRRRSITREEKTPLSHSLDLCRQQFSFICRTALVLPGRDCLTNEQVSQERVFAFTYCGAFSTAYRVLGGIVLAILSPGIHSLSGELAIAGSVCYVGVLAVGLPTNVRINKQIARWSVQSPPDDWANIRARWVRFHIEATTKTAEKFFRFNRK